MNTGVIRVDEYCAAILERLWRRFESLDDYDRQALQEAQQYFDENGKLRQRDVCFLSWMSTH